MKNFSSAFLVILFISALSTSSAVAQTASSSKADTTKEIKSVTHHSIVINGKTINYTATAGALVLRNEKDSAVALLGYTAYTMDGVTDMTKRPVTFAYNGGPGSSSIWLHMGAVGPKRVVLSDPDNNAPAPYKLEDNTNSIIDVSDLVMVDPVGTGISHAIGKSKNKDFWNVDGDIKSVSEFVKGYVMENDRWNSPKYLLGESYGTFRSAGVADYLYKNLGITVNGIVLVSSVLDLRSLLFMSGDDLSYILYLPTYAAVAWYHNKIPNKPADLESYLKEVRNFAEGEYASALMKGDALSDAEKNTIAQKLSNYTGLSKDYLLKADLRVAEPQFTAELLRDSDMTVGRLDARYKGLTQDLLSEYSNYDPQSASISNVYVPLFMNYYYGDLKMNKNYTYHTGAYDQPDFNWDWKHNQDGAGFGVSTPNTGVDLAEVMSQNPDLKVLVLNGYFDLATPFFGTEYTINHLGLPEAVRSNFTLKYFPAGHMMYIHPESLSAFKKNVSDFILNNKPATNPPANGATGATK